MPHVIIIAGCNGAGKSTSAPALLRDVVHIENFVNADVIAQGLSAFNPEGASIEAGRIMLSRIKTLASEKENFAFETTLASRTFAGWLKQLKSKSYQFHLMFLWLKDVELAISRVADRVRMGGHSIPEETIRRRYEAGLSNFFNLYSPIANSWHFYDNSDPDQLNLIAIKAQNKITILNQKIWKGLVEKYDE